jgi:hypothetical protein
MPDQLLPLRLLKGVIRSLHATLGIEIPGNLLIKGRGDPTEF